MKIILAAIVPRRSRVKGEAAEKLCVEFVKRAARYLPIELQLFEAEVDFLAAIEDPADRIKPYVISLDRRGKALSSEEFAGKIGTLRDAGTQKLVLAIGPADGWSHEATRRARFLLSFGPITLPHQLARVVLAEQVYRALSILAGHPYHLGH